MSIAVANIPRGDRNIFPCRVFNDLALRYSTFQTLSRIRLRVISLHVKFSGAPGAPCRAKWQEDFRCGLPSRSLWHLCWR
jgi:hypothetical protein